MTDEFKPDAVSTDYAAQSPFWTMVSAILEGEAAVKKAGKLYLPQFASETDTQYAARLQHSPFTNIYGDISKGIAAKPFSKELAQKEGTPEQYLKLGENIDGQGNNLHQFGSNVFAAALDYGIDWILVDYSRAKPRADGKPLTLADEREQGLRPYWVRIPAQRMIGVYSVFLGGVETIFHARISESSIDIDSNLKETAVNRVRIMSREPLRDALGNIVGLGPAEWRLWEQRTGQDGKSSWVLVDEGPITIGVIPLVPVVLGKRKGGSWIVEPPLRDLAHMQMTEYRQESNLEWVKIMTCFPMVCVSGMANGEDGKPPKVTVGPNVVFLIPQNQGGTGPAGEVTIVEPTAQSIVENRNQLELTRKEMRDLGMAPLTQSNLTVYTTANVSKKASSAIQAWAFLFKDALEQAWKLTALWLGDKAFEPEIVVHTDFAVELEQGREIDALLKAQGQGIYSKKTVREEFRRRNIVSNDIDDEEEEERIAADQEGMEPEEPIDPITGRPIREPDPVQ